MTLWTFLFAVALLVAGGFWYLWHLASNGDMMATVVLSIFGVAFIFILFKGMDIASDTLRDRAEHKRYEANMKENFDLMQAAFKAQSAGMLATQRHARLTDGKPPELDFDIPDAVFSVDD